LGEMGPLKAKLVHIFERQKFEMSHSKLEIYNKVSKYMPFDVPVYLYGLRDMLSSFLRH
jgi:hypothetical protein